MREQASTSRKNGRGGGRGKKYGTQFNQRRALKKQTPQLPYPLRQEWKDLSALGNPIDYDEYQQLGSISVTREADKAGVVRWKLDRRVVQMTQMEASRGFKGYSQEFDIHYHSDESLRTSWRMGWAVGEQGPGIVTVTLTCVEAQESVLNQIEVQGRSYVSNVRRWINFNHLFWVDYPEAVVYHCAYMDLGRLQNVDGYIEFKLDIQRWQRISPPAARMMRVVHDRDVFLLSLYPRLFVIDNFMQSNELSLMKYVCQHTLKKQPNYSQTLAHPHKAVLRSPPEDPRGLTTESQAIQGLCDRIGTWSSEISRLYESTALTVQPETLQIVHFKKGQSCPNFYSQQHMQNRNFRAMFITYLTQTIGGYTYFPCAGDLLFEITPGLKVAPAAGRAVLVWTHSNDGKYDPAALCQCEELQEQESVLLTCMLEIQVEEPFYAPYQPQPPQPQPPQPLPQSYPPQTQSPPQLVEVAPVPPSPTTPKHPTYTLDTLNKYQQQQQQEVEAQQRIEQQLLLQQQQAQAQQQQYLIPQHQQQQQQQSQEAVAYNQYYLQYQQQQPQQQPQLQYPVQRTIQQTQQQPVDQSLFYKQQQQQQQTQQLQAQQYLNQQQQQQVSQAQNDNVEQNMARIQSELARSLGSSYFSSETNKNNKEQVDHAMAIMREQQKPHRSLQPQQQQSQKQIKTQQQQQQMQQQVKAQQLEPIAEVEQQQQYQPNQQEFSAQQNSYAAALLRMKQGAQMQALPVKRRPATQQRSSSSQQSRQPQPPMAQEEVLGADEWEDVQPRRKSNKERRRPEFQGSTQSEAPIPASIDPSPFSQPPPQKLPEVHRENQEIVTSSKNLQQQPAQNLQKVQHVQNVAPTQQQDMYKPLATSWKDMASRKPQPQPTNVMQPSQKLPQQKRAQQNVDIPIKIVDSRSTQKPLDENQQNKANGRPTSDQKVEMQPKQQQQQYVGNQPANNQQVQQDSYKPVGTGWKDMAMKTPVKKPQQMVKTASPPKVPRKQANANTSPKQTKVIDNSQEISAQQSQAPQILEKEQQSARYESEIAAINANIESMKETIYQPSGTSWRDMATTSKQPTQKVQKPAQFQPESLIQIVDDRSQQQPKQEAKQEVKKPAKQQKVKEEQKQVKEGPKEEEQKIPYKPLGTSWKDMALKPRQEKPRQSQPAQISLQSKPYGADQEEASVLSRSDNRKAQRAQRKQNIQTSEADANKELSQFNAQQNQVEEYKPEISSWKDAIQNAQKPTPVESEQDVRAVHDIQIKMVDSSQTRDIQQKPKQQLQRQANKAKIEEESAQKVQQVPEATPYTPLGTSWKAMAMKPGTIKPKPKPKQQPPPKQTQQKQQTQVAQQQQSKQPFPEFQIAEVESSDFGQGFQIPEQQSASLAPSTPSPTHANQTNSSWKDIANKTTSSPPKPEKKQKEYTPFQAPQEQPLFHQLLEDHVEHVAPTQTTDKNQEEQKVEPQVQYQPISTGWRDALLKKQQQQQQLLQKQQQQKQFNKPVAAEAEQVLEEQFFEDVKQDDGDGLAAEVGMLVLNEPVASLSLWDSQQIDSEPSSQLENQSKQYNQIDLQQQQQLQVDAIEYEPQPVNLQLQKQKFETTTDATQSAQQTPPSTDELSVSVPAPKITVEDEQKQQREQYQQQEVQTQAQQQQQQLLQQQQQQLLQAQQQQRQQQLLNQYYYPTIPYYQQYLQQQQQMTQQPYPYYGASQSLFSHPYSYYFQQLQAAGLQQSLQQQQLQQQQQTQEPQQQVQHSKRDAQVLDVASEEQIQFKVDPVQYQQQQQQQLQQQQQQAEGDFSVQLSNNDVGVAEKQEPPPEWAQQDVQYQGQAPEPVPAWANEPVQQYQVGGGEPLPEWAQEPVEYEVASQEPVPEWADAQVDDSSRSHDLRNDTQQVQQVEVEQNVVEVVPEQSVLQQQQQHAMPQQGKTMSYAQMLQLKAAQQQAASKPTPKPVVRKPAAQQKKQPAPTPKKQTNVKPQQQDIVELQKPDEKQLQHQQKENQSASQKNKQPPRILVVPRPQQQTKKQQQTAVQDVDSQVVEQVVEPVQEIVEEPVVLTPAPNSWASIAKNNANKPLQQSKRLEQQRKAEKLARQQAQQQKLAAEKELQEQKRKNRRQGNRKTTAETVQLEPVTEHDENQFQAPLNDGVQIENFQQDVDKLQEFDNENAQPMKQDIESEEVVEITTVQLAEQPKVEDKQEDFVDEQIQQTQTQNASSTFSYADMLKKQSAQRAQQKIQSSGKNKQQKQKPVQQQLKFADQLPPEFVPQQQQQQNQQQQYPNVVYQDQGYNQEYQDDQVYAGEEEDQFGQIPKDTYMPNIDYMTPHVIDTAYLPTQSQGFFDDDGEEENEAPIIYCNRPSYFGLSTTFADFSGRAKDMNRSSFPTNEFFKQEASSPQSFQPTSQDHHQTRQPISRKIGLPSFSAAFFSNWGKGGDENFDDEDFGEDLSQFDFVPQQQQQQQQQQPRKKEAVREGSSRPQKAAAGPFGKKSLFKNSKPYDDKLSSLAFNMTQSGNEMGTWNSSQHFENGLLDQSQQEAYGSLNAPPGGMQVPLVGVNLGNGGQGAKWGDIMEDMDEYSAAMQQQAETGPSTNPHY